MNIKIRSIRKNEYPLLNEFLYEAIFIPEGMERPPKSVVYCPQLQVYVAGFGNSKHDKALLAEADGQVIGAVWVRIMDDYGHIDADTPSLAMSVLKNYRGRGVGTLLLKRMIQYEKKAGYGRISLSVQKGNYAVNMYQKAGFIIVGEISEEYQMVCNLNGLKEREGENGI